MTEEQQEDIKAGKKDHMKFFLLDSSNMIHLDKADYDLPDVVMERVHEKVRLGLKATNKFLIQMTIQSLFDQRAFFQKIIPCFTGKGPNFMQLVTNCYCHNILKQFHPYVASMLPESEALTMPQSAIFASRPCIEQKDEILSSESELEDELIEEIKEE